MAKDYTLLIQKSLSGSQTKSTLSDFGFACESVPWPDEETQEVTTRQWPGVHGEDAYIPPSGLKLQAYDLEVELLYKGDVHTAYAAYKKLRDYLIGADGSGAEFYLYDPYWRRGCAGVHVVKFGSPTPVRTNVDESISVKITFRVTDPATDITLTYVGD